MKSLWQHIHPSFKLNGKSYSTEQLIDVAQSFQQGSQEEKAFAGFLSDWLSSQNTLEAHTSGSTGKPKTIVLEKTKMISSAKATGSYFDLLSETKALHCLSANYIAGKMMLVRALILGWHLDVVAPDKFPLAQVNGTYDFAAMVPMQVQNSLKDLHRVKKIIVGGAAVSVQLAAKLQTVTANVYTTYGMTETITHIAVKKLNHKIPKNIFDDVYEALPRVEFSVDDRNCLVIDAPSVSDEKVKTNDVVRLVSPKQFVWLGRADFVINSGGHKVHPEQVEQVLALVIDAPFFVTSLPDEELGEKVVLIIEGKEAAFPEIDYAGLHAYEIPKRVYFIDEMVCTSTGKIQQEKTKALLFS